MKYTKVLRQAWEMVWRYRALWILGALLALTTANGFYFGYGWNWDEDEWRSSIRVAKHATIYLPGEGLHIDLTAPGEPHVQVEWGQLHELEEVLTDLFRGTTSGAIRHHGVAILITGSIVLVGMLLVGIVARYVAEAALIRMVAETEKTGEKLSVRQGLRLGWSRSAWRLFLIDLAIHLPVTLALVLLFLVALFPLLLWISGSVAAGLVGTLFSTGLLFLAIVVVIAVKAVASLLIQVVRRACAVEELSVIASIRRGLAMVKGHLQDVVVVWLIWLGTRFLWMVAMVPVMIVLLPITLLFMGVGIVLGGMPAVVVGAVGSLFLQGATPWILGAIVGAPVLILVMIAPTLLLSGLVEVFKSSTWTLAYRELCALERKAPSKVSQQAVSGLGAAQAA